MSSVRARSPHLRLLAVPAAAVLALGLVACSGDDDGADGGGDPSSTASASGGADGEETPGTVSPPLPDAPKIRRAKGAVADIQLEECPTDEGEQVATGTVTNPRGKATDYLITISWVNDTSDVLGRGYATIQDLEGGDSTEWEAVGQVAAGATDCTTNVQRGRIPG